MTRSPLRDFIVGLFVLVGLGAIGYLSIAVGGLSLTGPRGMPLFAAFDQIGGLKPRAPVVISGVRVGDVQTITLDDDYRARSSRLAESRSAATWQADILAGDSSHLAQPQKPYEPLQTPLRVGASADSFCLRDHAAAHPFAP